MVVVALLGVVIVVDAGFPDFATQTPVPVAAIVTVEF